VDESHQYFGRLSQICFYVLKLWVRQWIVGNLVTERPIPRDFVPSPGRVKGHLWLKYGQISVAAEQMTFYVND
jgi:hypothetical protein